MDLDDLLRLQLQGGGLGGLFTSGKSWISAVLLAFLFAVAVFRPERIINAKALRKAFVFLALSIVLPSLGYMLVLLAAFGTSPSGISRAGSGIPVLIMQFFNNAPPILLGISILFAMVAVVPRFIPPTLREESSRGDDPRATGSTSR